MTSSSLVQFSPLVPHSLEEVQVGVVNWGTHGLSDLFIIKNHPATFFPDVADIMATGSGGAHVAHEGKEAIL